MRVCLMDRFLPCRALEVVRRNAAPQLRPKAGASQERGLLGVGSTALILIEAPSSAYPGGMLRVTTTLVTNKEEASRRFYTNQPPFYCGIDLHARTMYVCVLSQSGNVLVHRPMKTDPETFLKAIAPYRQGLVVAVACMCTWYWLADPRVAEDILFSLGSV